ncbi:hypothetical protein [Streptomyces sp. NPDC020983]|uniref:hypothetical protein n=1 Tax=Streptomyces sp. NPDC020983 TaxID=3365106 RepID=UPI0037B84388
MQSQQPATGAPPAVPPAPPQPRRRTAATALALVAGLVLGAGAVGAGWALSGGDGAPAAGTSPAGDARAACQALGGFEESAYGTKGPEGDIAVNRYAAAGALSAAAAAGDASYEPLAGAVRRSQERHARVFAFDAQARHDLDEARRICAALP